jgi:dihydrofolate synthase/folylpolyglutamate synthase
VEALQMNGVYITDESIKEGIQKATNPGRMEIFGYEPIIILDGAHNVAGINSLKETLVEDFNYENWKKKMVSKRNLL